MEICFLILNERTEFEQYKSLLSLVPAKNLEKINALKLDAAQKLRLFSDIFLRYVISKNLNIKNKDIGFSYNEYGKPSLVGYPQFHFNISHTRGAIAVAISEEPVGVDVEKIGSVDTNIARRFFTINEYNYIFNADDNKLQNNRFYEIWTKKEAYMKWAGKGLSIPLNSFDVLAKNFEESFYTFNIEEYLISVYTSHLDSQKILTKMFDEKICSEYLNDGSYQL